MLEGDGETQIGVGGQVVISTILMKWSAPTECPYTYCSRSWLVYPPEYEVVVRLD